MDDSQAIAIALNALATPAHDALAYTLKVCPVVNQPFLRKSRWRPYSHRICFPTKKKRGAHYEVLVGGSQQKPIHYTQCIAPHAVDFRSWNFQMGSGKFQKALGLPFPRDGDSSPWWDVTASETMCVRPEDQIEQILEKISPYAAQIRAVMNMPGSFARIDVCWFAI